MKKTVRSLLTATLLLMVIPVMLHGQLAGGSSKFFGCILKHNERIDPRFSNYFNQVTPENSGKWTSVEEQRDVMDWTNLDSMYQFSLRNGYPFKQHTFVWGMQQPGWIGSLSPAEQKEEVEEWIASFCERYPDVEFIDPANEPIHQPPSYKDALGGNGTTGWDWLIWVHRKAREYAPEAILILNEFDVLKNAGTKDKFMEIASLLQDSGLVDALGCQGHWLEGTSAATIKSHLDELATLGLDIYISELDLSFTNDQNQLQKYQEIFPVLWEHPAVKGITLWGYQEGAIWRENGFLTRSDGSERPALKWLRTNYFESSGVPFARISSPADGTFLKAGAGSVAAALEVEESGIAVRSAVFLDGRDTLGTDHEAPFEQLVTDLRTDPPYHLTAVAYSDSSRYVTQYVSFTFLNSGTVLPFLERFEQEDGTVREEGDYPWNTLADTRGTFAVRDHRFRANNLDDHAFWSCLVDISGSGPVDLALEVLAEGGLDEDQDYLRVSYILDGGDPVTLFRGDALFNNGRPLQLSAGGLEGNNLQLIIEAYNTGSSEIYSWDDISITPEVIGSDPTDRNQELIRIYPVPSREFFTLTLPVPAGNQCTLDVIDIRGRIVLRRPGLQGKQAIIRHHLDPGVYLCRLSDQDGTLAILRLMVSTL